MKKTVYPGKPYPVGLSWDVEGVNIDLYADRAILRRAACSGRVAGRSRLRLSLRQMLFRILKCKIIEGLAAARSRENLLVAAKCFHLKTRVGRAVLAGIDFGRKKIYESI